MDVAIIGGGASGFFSAIAVKENHPEANVTLFEKSKTVLAKVKISGGGRCNVTNGCPSIKELSKAYPRGEQFLKKAFRVFSNKDAMKWFESKNVPLVIQDDNCVFPKSQDSQTIIDCFLDQARRLGVKIEVGAGIKNIKQAGRRLAVDFEDQKRPSRKFEKIIVSTGGCPKRKNLAWLERLNHEIEDPVPSLFTFNMPGDSIRKLMGVVVEKTIVSIQGTKFKTEGDPLLITHWGMSGPAILKLSSFGARVLNGKGYAFNVQVNWVNENNQESVRNELEKIVKEHSKKIISNVRPFSLPDRLWQFLIKKCNLSERKKWGEIGKKGLNKLVTILTNDVYSVKSKTSFRDEFVTCGGVSLKSVDVKTMQSRACPNLYLTGELLDIDGITGGFNFQAAWTTAFIAGKLN